MDEVLEDAELIDCFADERHCFQGLWCPCFSALTNHWLEPNALGLTRFLGIQVAAFCLWISLSCSYWSAWSLADYALPLWCRYDKIKRRR